jgi:hypothetical protein
MLCSSALLLKLANSIIQQTSFINFIILPPTTAPYQWV